jgi:hypothetical protein
MMLQSFGNAVIPRTGFAIPVDRGQNTKGAMPMNRKTKTPVLTVRRDLTRCACTEAGDGG